MGFYSSEWSTPGRPWPDHALCAAEFSAESALGRPPLAGTIHSAVLSLCAGLVQQILLDAFLKSINGPNGELVRKICRPKRKAYP